MNAIRSLDAEHERALSALHAIPASCDRDTWIKAGMAAKAAGLDFAEFNAWSATADNYGGDRETHQVWKSFTVDGGRGPGTLFAVAREYGWSDRTPNAHIGPRVGPTTEPVRRAPAWPAVVAWTECEDADAAHSYIARKRGSAEGLRVYPASAPPRLVAGEDVRGWLVVPAYGAAGELATLQLISPVPGGRKLNLPGHSVAGWFTLGDLTPGAKAYVCEGIGAAWAAYQATGTASLVAFGSGNQRKVAEAVKRMGASPVIVADRGKESQCERAAREVGCEWAAMPADLPENGDLDDIKQAEGIDAVRTVLDRAQPAPANDADASPNPLAPTFAFTAVGDSLRAGLKPVHWLVRNYVEADSLALMFGDPGCGKSFAAIDLACSVATGTPWHGNKTTEGAVFYIAGEGQNGLMRRFAAWSQHNEIPLMGVPLFVGHRPAQLCNAAAAAEVANAVEEIQAATVHKPALIVVDTLARNFGGDENNQEDMGAFIANLDLFLRRSGEWGATVLVVHHSGHSDKSRGRGSSALKGAVDAEYSLTKDESGVVRMEATKMKDAAQPAPVAFKLETVVLDGLTDDEGEPVTSSVLWSVAHVPPTRNGKAGRGRNQTLALSALADLVDEHRSKLVAAGHSPNGARVTLDEWRDRLAASGIDRRRFFDLRNTLRDAGMIVVEFGDYVRLTNDSPL